MTEVPLWTRALIVDLLVRRIELAGEGSVTGLFYLPSLYSIADELLAAAPSSAKPALGETNNNPESKANPQ